jgi:hypothetical protein
MKFFDDLKGLTGAGMAALYCVGLGFFAALGVLGWQAVGWLRTGEWTTLTLLSGLASGGVEWASSPDSWIGIYNLLNHVPLTVAVFWAGMLPALIFMLIHNWAVQRRRP